MAEKGRDIKQQTNAMTYCSFKLETKLKSMMSPIVTRAPALEHPIKQLAEDLSISIQMKVAW